MLTFLLSEMYRETVVIFKKNKKSSKRKSELAQEDQQQVSYISEIQATIKSNSH